MYCPKCGNQVDEGSKFCMTCGAQIDNAAPTASGEDKPLIYAQQPIPQPPAEPVEENGSNIFAILACCLCIIPLLGIIFGCLGLSKAKKLGGKGKTAATIGIILAVIMWILNFIVLMQNGGNIPT